MLLVPTREEPLTAAALVGVEVADPHDDPSAAVLMFGPAVDPTLGMVWIDEFDLMTTDEVDRPVEPAQLRLDVALECLTPTAMAPAVDVLGERAYPAVEITRIEERAAAAEPVA